MAQVAQVCLPNKRQDLSLNCSTTKKKKKCLCARLSKTK
jgi:hypothetical protein